jgi:transposase
MRCQAQPVQCWCRLHRLRHSAGPREHAVIFLDPPMTSKRLSVRTFPYGRTRVLSLLRVPCVHASPHDTRTKTGVPTVRAQARSGVDADEPTAGQRVSTRETNGTSVCGASCAGHLVRYGFASRSRSCLNCEQHITLACCKGKYKATSRRMARAALDGKAKLLSATARDWREGRRLRALELLAEGYRASVVARVLGVSPGAVSQWSKRARVGGAEALLKRKRLGRDSRLTPCQLEELRLILVERANGGACTTRKVAQIIAEKWGIHYSRAHVSRILKALGLPSATRSTPPALLLTSA